MGEWKLFDVWMIGDNDVGDGGSEKVGLEFDSELVSL